MATVATPTYTKTSDEEMLNKSKAELKELAGGRKSKIQARAQAELDRRKANLPYKAWKRAQKAAA